MVKRIKPRRPAEESCNVTLWTWEETSNTSPLAQTGYFLLQFNLALFWGKYRKPTAENVTYMYFDIFVDTEIQIFPTKIPGWFSSNNFQHLCFLLTSIGQSSFQAGLFLKIIIDDQQQRWDSKDEQMMQCNHRVSGRPSRLKWCFLAFGQKEKFAAKRVADKTGEWLWWQQGNQMMLMLLKRIWPVNDEIDAWVENPHRVGEMAQTHNLRQKQLVRLPTGCLKRLKPNCAQKLNLVWSHPKWRDEVEGRKDLLDVLKIVVRLFFNSKLLKEKKISPVDDIWREILDRKPPGK